MEAASIIVGVASLIQGIQPGFEIFLEHGQNSRWVSLYGFRRTFFLQLAFPDALDMIGRIHKDVIQDGTLHAATLTRDATCANYNMTAVAVSIFHPLTVSMTDRNRTGGDHCAGGHLRPRP